MSQDIGPMLEGWDYRPDDPVVRKITGADGRAKIQLRVDLGLLQMEVTGRPDGRRPYDHDSLLDYYNHLLEAHVDKNDSTDGFVLDGDDCMKLQLESMQYYHRRISLLELEDFKAAVADADHNLGVMDLIDKYASDEHQREMFLQYRPFVMVHRTMAQARLHSQRKEYDEALHTLEQAIDEIRSFYRERSQDELAEGSGEIAYLERLAEEIMDNRPLSLDQKLEQELEEAVDDEDFERAAQLRDELAILRVNLTERPDLDQ